QASLQLDVEAIMDLGADVNGAAGRADMLDRLPDVARLVLEQADDRVRQRPGVRAVAHEQVREAGRRQAEVGLGAVRPRLADLDSVAAGYPHRRDVLRRREPRAPADGGSCELLAVGRQ